MLINSRTLINTKQITNKISSCKVHIARNALKTRLAFCVFQVKVYIRVVFLKVGEINTLKEKYAADVFLQARWRQPEHRTMQVSHGETNRITENK